MDELLSEFIAETREMLEALSGQLVAWEAAPGDRARLDGIFRFVHTVKGNSGFFDLPRIAALSHKAEDVLAAVRDGRREADAALVSAVLAAVDRIGALADALETGAEVPEDDERLIAALSGKAAPAPVVAAATEPRAGARSVRVSIELLDRIMNGISDAVLARNALSRRMREDGAPASLEAAFERVSASIGEIQDAVMRTRMQRIDSLFAALPRLVRDLSAELGKDVRLEIDGGHVEIDREMIETLRDPLTHIVRNALDHGFEPPAERVQAGKPTAGTLRIGARQAGNQIVIEVADDGRGVDADALARRAVGAGSISREAAASLSQAQKTALIFQPGLSTAPEVTALSGRGVGMDVVRANVERIGGLVEAESRPGEGLRLLIRVPLTLTIIPALTVGASGSTYAIPRGAIEEILRTASEAVEIERVGGGAIARVRGRRMPLVSLPALLGGGKGEGTCETIVLLKPAAGGAYALGVDVVHDHVELVVKPAAPAVMAACLYAGTTLADDGRPILLLDPAGIAACAGIDLGAVEAEAPAAPAEQSAARETADMLLFRGLDGGRRAIRLAIVDRIEDVDAAAVARTGGRLRVRIGDALVPLAGCEAAPEGRLRILRLSDGAAELAYGFAEVIDIVATGAQVQPAASPGEIAGVALIGGEQVEVLDPFWLFATYAAALPEPGRRLVCALPADDPWMHAFLRPLVESLGYEVVPGGPCDVRILAEDAAEDAAGESGGAGETIRLTACPDAGGRRDGSIYRYDRAALLAALGRSRANG